MNTEIARGKVLVFLFKSFFFFLNLSEHIYETAVHLEILNREEGRVKYSIV